MYYTHILESLSQPDQRYIGYTSDLKARLAKHNAGKCPHTAKYLPWRVLVYVAFVEREKAHRFEKYLKSGSGHSFAKRHF